MSLAVGQHLGVYVIVAPLGAGGMGEVWRARDTRLGREVALKVLPSAFALDPERMNRFEREAKLLASLSHPNVATLYGLEDLDGQRVLAMELAEGEDLSKRIQRGPVPSDEALLIARQIADALEQAHEKGIVHRDLKPANVKLGSDGQVKVLDFGLAKAWAGEAGSDSAADFSRSPTLAHTGTLAGLILGTAAYMAPEQAAGRPVDRRADVWAFGVVLFEMLSGRPLFSGETVSEVLASVIKEEPDWSQLPAGVPPGVVRLLRRCLKKKPRERMHDIGDVRLELEELIAGAGTAAPAEAAPAARQPFRAWLVGAVVAAALLGAVGGYLARRSPPESRVLAFDVQPPPGTSFHLDTERPSVPVLSPDGRMLAFTAADGGRFSLHVRALDATTPRPVPGTEGAQYPFWSPDSTQIGFFAEGRLKRVQVVGNAGPPVALCSAMEMKGASWGAEGVIVFAPEAGTGLLRVSEGGGEPEPVTKLDPARKENSHRHPRFLPDGRHFLFLARIDGATEHAVMVASLDGAPPRELLRSPAAAEYASGQLLFLRERTLMARPFDTGRLEPSGEVYPVAEDVRLVGAGPTGTSLAVFSASAAGVLAYQQEAVADARRLVWRDREGKEVGAVGDRAEYAAPRISPRGDLAAVQVAGEDGGQDIWLVDLARNVRSRFTSGAGDEIAPLWWPDGRSVVMGCELKGTVDICRKDLTSSEPQLLYESKTDKYPGSLSPDGRLLLYGQQGAKTDFDIWLLPLEGGRAQEPRPWLQTHFIEVLPRISPDGRLVAYMSNESGRMEIYVTPFPGPGRRWQITGGGETHPEWEAGGRRLFYRGSEGVGTVSIALRGDQLEVGPPRLLFPAVLETRSPLLAPAPDSQRILSVEAGETKKTDTLTVVVNWAARRSR